MPNPKDAKDPEEDREPQRRDVGADDEVEETAEAQAVAGDELLEELYEDDLLAMEGPDA